MGGCVVAWESVCERSNEANRSETVAGCETTVALVSWINPSKTFQSCFSRASCMRRSTRTHAPRMARPCTAIPRPGAYRPRLAYSIRWSSFLYLVRLYDEGEALAAEAARDDLMREAAVELGDAFLVSRSTHALLAREVKRLKQRSFAPEKSPSASAYW